ncbi:MAG: glycosyltransferase [Actinomycetota bacterium]|nr:glycosyltransferase [Actinomycetota bacterium]
MVFPTYNRAATLGRAVRSVLGQTFADLELIVIDDGSSDNTSEVIADIGDARLIYIRLPENKGVAYARNVGLEEASGEYVAFQDSDDEWLADKLRRQVQAMESEPAETGIIYTVMIWVDKDGFAKYRRAPDVTSADPIDRRRHEYQVFGLGIVTVLARRPCFEQVGGFDASLPKFIDQDLLTRLAREYRFRHIREALIRCYSSEGISSNHYNEFTARRLLLEKYAAYVRGDKAFLG